MCVRTLDGKGSCCVAAWPYPLCGHMQLCVYVYVWCTCACMRVCALNGNQGFNLKLLCFSMATPFRHQDCKLQESGHMFHTQSVHHIYTSIECLLVYVV